LSECVIDRLMWTFRRFSTYFVRIRIDFEAIGSSNKNVCSTSGRLCLLSTVNIEGVSYVRVDLILFMIFSMYYSPML